MKVLGWGQSRAGLQVEILKYSFMLPHISAHIIASYNVGKIYPLPDLDLILQSAHEDSIAEDVSLVLF